MPLGNNNDNGSTSSGGDWLAVDRLLTETQQMLDNTRNFLAALEEDDEDARTYLEELNSNLKNDMRRLEDKRRREPPHDRQPDR